MDRESHRNSDRSDPFLLNEEKPSARDRHFLVITYRCSEVIVG